MDRVVVFIDYQNIHLAAHKKFSASGTPLSLTHIAPEALAQLLVSRRRRQGTLVEVRVYRGLPSTVLQPAAAAANERQADAWKRHPKVTVIRRPLRYPSNWPAAPAQEKGIDVALAVDVVRMAMEKRYDVGIVVSRDTDLVPCLETVMDFRLAHVEVASWDGYGGLRVPGTVRPWCHYMYRADYDAVRDPTDYTASN